MTGELGPLMDHLGFPSGLLIVRVGPGKSFPGLAARTLWLGSAHTYQPLHFKKPVSTLWLRCGRSPDQGPKFMQLQLCARSTGVWQQRLLVALLLPDSMWLLQSVTAGEKGIAVHFTAAAQSPSAKIKLVILWSGS